MSANCVNVMAPNNIIILEKADVPVSWIVALDMVFRIVLRNLAVFTEYVVS